MLTCADVCRLNDTNLALAAAEAERDKLRKELDLATRNKQSLLTWKVFV